MADVKLLLLQNAQSFVAEALFKAILAEKDSTQWKYAILNLVQAIELSLKELLRQQHPSLIYKDVDKQTETVSLKFARSRLEQIAGIKFEKTDLDSIQTASEYRNRIVHYEFNFKAEDAKLIFAKLLGFLQDFHSAHFDNHLSNIIPSSVWQEAVGVLDYATELFERAQSRCKAEKIDPDLIWACRHCCWESFVIQSDINRCYVCGAKDSTFRCDECHRLSYWTASVDFEKNGTRICRRCINLMDEDI